MTSENHQKLERKAIKWLKQKGFSDIELEVIVLSPLNEDVKYGKEIGRFRIDVVARHNSRRIAIECGGSKSKDRLLAVKDNFNELYIWPYGAEEPYLWSEDINVCKQCGHKI